MCICQLQWNVPLISFHWLFMRHLVSKPHIYLNYVQEFFFIEFSANIEFFSCVTSNLNGKMRKFANCSGFGQNKHKKNPLKFELIFVKKSMEENCACAKSPTKKKIKKNRNNRNEGKKYTNDFCSSKSSINHMDCVYMVFLSALALFSLSNVYATGNITLT